MTDQLPDPRLSKVYRLEATLGQPLISATSSKATGASCR